MNKLSPAHLEFENRVINISTKDIEILENVDRFPVYGKDFTTDNLIICINHHGTGHAIYDLQKVTFCRNDIAVIMPHHTIKAISSSDDYLVTLIVISQTFFLKIMEIQQIHKFLTYHNSPSYTLNNQQAEQLKSITYLLKNISESIREDRQELLYKALDIFFAFLNLYRHDSGENEKKSNKIFYEFCNLLAKNYKISHKVKYYAELLHITPRHLSKVIKTATGKSGNYYITNYIMTRAKDVLTSRSDLSIQDLCDLLGFSEQSSFCRYFKRTTGVSPKAYLLRHK